MLSPLHLSTVVRNLWDLFGFLIRETNGIGGILFFLDGGREVLVWVAFVFFFLKKENYIFSGSHLSLFYKKQRDLTFPWCQCGSQKLLIPVCVLHSIVGSLDIIEGPWFFFVVVFGCAMWSAGLQFPDQGLNLSPQQWEREVLTTGPPGKSQRVLGSDCVSKATMRNYYLPLEKNKRKFFFLLHCP